MDGNSHATPSAVISTTMPTVSDSFGISGNASTVRPTMANGNNRRIAQYICTAACER
ncbi:hypothetical protein D3C84_814170 [compost metagenome]